MNPVTETKPEVKEMREIKVPYTQISYTYNISEKFGKEELTVTIVGPVNKAELEKAIKDVKEATKANMETKASAVPSAAKMFTNNKE